MSSARARLAGALAVAALMGGCAASTTEPTPAAGLAFQPVTAPGSTIVLECPLERCGIAPLAFSVRALASEAVAAATVRSRFLDGAGRECLFVFAPRQDVPAGQPVTFSVSRVLVSETTPGRLACQPPFTTATVDMALLDGAGVSVLTGQTLASYTFALPPGVP